MLRRSYPLAKRFAVRSLHACRAARAPVILPAGLPASVPLREEGLDVRSDRSTEALQVLVFNLMPLKEQTERQLARMLGQSDILVELSFAVPDGSKNKNTPPEHIEAFYSKFSQIKDNRYDGVIVTGAPVEHLPFEDVLYWSELQEIFEWIRSSDTGMYSICWGAMASLYHFHGVPKHITPAKQFGLFPHSLLQKCSLTEGLEDGVGIPVSRHTEWQMDDMGNLPDGVDVLVMSPETGPCVIWDRSLNHVHMMNHFEYEADTLDQEYRRDVDKGTPTGEPIALPHYYYPGNNPDNAPVHTWKNNGQVFFVNWLSSLRK